MPKGVTKRRPMTVAALLDAALDLFADQGFGATSIPEICTRAGLTKGAFYSNFTDKEALFLALFDRQAATRAARIRAMLANAQALAEAVQTGTMRTGAVRTEPVLPGMDFDETDRRWFLISTEFTLHAIRHPHVAAMLADHESLTRAELAELLTRALEAIGRVPLVAVQDLVAMLVAAYEGAAVQALSNQAASRDDTAGLGTRMIAALLRQLTAPADHATDHTTDHPATPAPVPEERQP
jgi:AcrR family transcriptional regulator